VAQLVAAIRKKVVSTLFPAMQAIRQAIGMTGAELARATGYSVHHTCRILRGYTPSKECQDAIQRAVAEKGRFLDALEPWPELNESGDEWLLYEGKDIDAANLLEAVELLPPRDAARVKRWLAGGFGYFKRHAIENQISALRKIISKPCKP
jgi:transcriptional regulator with XRE-family HTH domain